MRNVTRQIAVCIALVATGALLTACGASSHPARRTGTATAAHPAGKPAPDAGQPRSGPAVVGALPTKAKAIAFARAVNLRAADVPGFTASAHEHEHETAGERQLEREMMMRCVGTSTSPHGALAEASSKDFKLERNLLEVSVSSSVSVARTPALAAEQLAAFRSRHVQACLSRSLDVLLKRKEHRGVTVGPVSISSGTPPAPGTTGGFAWRISVAISARRIKIPFYLDILGFVDGQAGVTLSSSGLAEPFPAAIQQRLYLLLLQRAKADGA
jgi:hypothetical protein